MNDFFSVKKHKANKDHICYVCKTKIDKGQEYSRWSGAYEGDFFDTKLHLECARLVNSYCKINDEQEWDSDTVIDWIGDLVCYDCLGKEYCGIVRPTCSKVIEKLAPAQ
jgi:hypothetical protein